MNDGPYRLTTAVDNPGAVSSNRSDWRKFPKLHPGLYFLSRRHGQTVFNRYFRRYGCGERVTDESFPDQWSVLVENLVPDNSLEGLLGYHVQENGIDLVELLVSLSSCFLSLDPIEQAIAEQIRKNDE